AKSPGSATRAPSSVGNSSTGIDPPGRATGTPAGTSGAVAANHWPSRRWPSSVRSSGPGPEVAKLASAPSVPATSATRTILVEERMSRPPSARRRSLAHALGERRRGLEADQAQPAQFGAVHEEQRARRADDAVALHQRLVHRVVGGDVG